MRWFIFILCLPVTAMALPISGSAPTPKDFLELGGNATLSRFGAEITALGRLGISDTVDTGIYVGMLAGSDTGFSMGIPTRILWLSQAQTNNIIRVSTDGTLSLSKFNDAIITQVSATVSASHTGRLFGLPRDIDYRLSIGGTAENQDLPNLDDRLTLEPTLLIGFGFSIFSKWKSSLEAGLFGNTAIVAVETTHQF